MNLNRVRAAFAAPKYLSQPTAGIDISSNGIKSVVLTEGAHGLEIASFGEESFASGSFVGGEIREPHALVHTLETLAHKHQIHTANVSMPESRGYLFEAEVPGENPAVWTAAIEQKLDEYVPLPPAEVLFGITPIGSVGDSTHVVGVGYGRKVIEEYLHIFDDAKIAVRAIGSETFALPRALLRPGDSETVLIIDIGKSTTKLLVVTKRIPRFVTTLDIGGHSLTLAVQKYFGVTEEEAKKVKAERGIAPGAGNEEYLAAMLSTVSAIKEEVVRRLDYWQSRSASLNFYEPVSRAILVGGNATVRGLPEYLQGALNVPVALGDVFTNLASQDDWLPPMDYAESLGFGTAIGLALREYSN